MTRTVPRSKAVEIAISLGFLTLSPKKSMLPQLRGSGGAGRGTRCSSAGGRGPRHGRSN
eukprot:CAMPEP_0182910672 /NCGR_PEP_ID=MMETSP0034_2-20130328/36459_1 /TAXON_ID=156128 /ORGANISM="Nephroselmis pyriformis, Strain CCMP717" /LENGTH=58 /DNA_ID=CAMNT_0025047065 /DNA_START=175 /DNA_END=348 /DNA_ORIENTATION=-